MDTRVPVDAIKVAPPTPSNPFLGMFRFLLEHAIATGPRLGRLSVRNPLIKDAPVHTPNYVATTSRGVIPHLSHDVLRKHTNVRIVYCGLEDFIEKARSRGNSGHIEEAPIFKTPHPHRQDAGSGTAATVVGDSKSKSNGSAEESTANISLLRTYTALPDNTLSILGPRRVPRIECPAQNTNSSISICTSIGFADLTLEEYNLALKKLQPDMGISMADLVFKDDDEKVSRKRVEKIADRTHAWLRDTVTPFQKKDPEAQKQEVQQITPPVFASIPPLQKEQQRLYLSDLDGEYADKVQGICLYSADTALDLPESVLHLPKICLDTPATPHAVLRAVSLGIDLITLPFVTVASEAGLAFDFTFPAPTSDQPDSTIEEQQANPRPLALDLWSTDHTTSLEPLTPSCPCYTCTRHHRAYIHHLLSAKEMLAWTLLQIHNFHAIDMFFQGIRSSLSQGPEKFEEDVKMFGKVYEAELPIATGEGPRVRGYQMKSAGGGEKKKNRKVWGRLDEQVEKLRESAEGGAAASDADESVMRNQEGEIEVNSEAVDRLHKTNGENGASVDGEVLEQHGLGKKVD